MGSKQIGRRDLLQIAAVMVGAATVSSKANAAPCVAPNGSDAELRTSLHYTATSANPAQKCSACSFFSEPQGACGKCMIFNTPTDAAGHCDSWAARS